LSFIVFPNYRNSKNITRRQSAYILKTQNIAVVWQSYLYQNLFLHNLTMIAALISAGFHDIPSVFAIFSLPIL